VWEDVRFDGVRHRSLLDLPGMADRVVKIGSAGKIFGLTGWKIGWAVAGAELIGLVRRAHQFLTYSSAPPLQWAVAEGLTLPDAWFAERTAGWCTARERLANGLSEAGFAVLPSAATWFVCVDLAASGIALDDRAFAERAVCEAGVAAIPVSAFGQGASRPGSIVRFCFTKPAGQLDLAVARLVAWRQTGV